MRIIFVTICLCIVASSNALAREDPLSRFALVIGNNDYVSSPLSNAVNDANDIAKALETVGFEVVLLTNVDKISLQKSVGEYYRRLRNIPPQRVLSLFYYAGHAVQIDHRNYLVPLNFQSGSEQFASSLFDINSLFELIPRDLDLTNIIILDACRDNPLGQQTQLSGDGLAPLRAPPSTLIAYSTEPGNVAEDGSGDNGLYTHHLLNHIKQKIPVEEVFRKVRKKVAKETGNRQIPWEHSSLVEEVYINTPENKDLPDLLTF